MPFLNIQTNQDIDGSRRSALLKQTSRMVAQQLGKPESYVMVALETNRPMLFAGSDAPLAYLELKSIGLPASSTAKLSQALCALMAEQLDVAQDRVYIEFADAAPQMWGWNGDTF
jgi:phenylpyruvate tautomerase PptA (4-oxalocrotonate tautomerase family)